MESKNCPLKNTQYLDTIRALHKTIVLLRGALETSRVELIQLKTKTWPIECLESAITALSIENHLLRQKILNVDQAKSNDTTENLIGFQSDCKLSSSKSINFNEQKPCPLNVSGNVISKETDIFTSTSINKISLNENSKSDCSNHDITKKIQVNIEENKQLHANTGLEILSNISVQSNDQIINFPNEVYTNKIPGPSLPILIKADVYDSSRRHINSKPELKMSDNEPNKEFEVKNELVLQHSCSTDVLDQEVDNIELIFTNEDTKETNLKEQLISIDGGIDPQNLQCQMTEFDQNLSTEVSDKELEDDVFNDNFENENNENTNFQSQIFDFTREISKVCISKSNNSINQDDLKSLKSFNSYQDSSFDNKSLEKDESFDRFEERISIVETDMSKVGIQDVEYSLGRRNTCPNPISYTPILHRDSMSRGLITRKSRPILAHSNAIRKESGAQTDISALPNKCSWRSESSLANKVKSGEKFATLPSKYPLPGSKLRLAEKTVEARRVLLSDIGFTSMVPELSRSADHLFPPQLKPSINTTYGQFLKTSDLYSPGYTTQRFAWNTISPSDSHSQSRYSSMFPISSPPVPTRRCSAPVSPSRRNVYRNPLMKVRFANGSLPELRSDWNTTVDSGDSTDSLVEEAEQYLRRSIDCMVRSKYHAYTGSPKAGLRRASAPEPAGDSIPPQGWMPFLPRLPRDLRLDYWVKVISQEGRVRGGRVRYIGHLLSQSEQFVGVQLGTPDGSSDGTYNNRRYFQCEPCHGIFVPFKKVIMGWKP